MKNQVMTREKREHVVKIRSGLAQGAFSPLSPSRRQKFQGPGFDNQLWVCDAQMNLTAPLGSTRRVDDILSALLYEHGEHIWPNVEYPISQDPSTDVRVDLTDLVTFTIDGDYSRDFDDAISAQKEDVGVRVWVHVADVTAYVQEDSELDHLARSRATSVYLPTKVVPMLPEYLSNGLCSLVPGEKRLAVTCEMLVVAGEVMESKIYRSTILSDARLTYGQVNQMFYGQLEPGPTYSAALEAARLASRVDEYDAELRLEPSFEIRDGKVISLKYHTHDKSQKLIERLMILANQTVAQFLKEQAKFGLYRIHAGQSEIKMQNCLIKLQALGINCQTLAEASFVISQKAQKDPNNGKWAAMMEMIRHTNVAAEYTTEHGSHEGLELDEYTHFTSPIRRYSDMIVHRLLLDALNIQKTYHSPAQIDSLCDHLNARFRHAKKLERIANDVCLTSYFMNCHRPGSIFKGRVSGMIEQGIFVQVAETEGFIPARLVGGHMIASGWESEHGLWQLTDEIQVTVDHIDLIRGKITLKLA